jgi:hypothetical protein
MRRTATPSRLMGDVDHFVYLTTEAKSSGEIQGSVVSDGWTGGTAMKVEGKAELGPYSGACVIHHCSRLSTPLVVLS